MVPVVFDFLRELCGFSSRTLRLKLSFSRQRKALNRKGRKGATAKNHYPLHFSTALWLVISDSALIVTGSPVPTADCRGSPTRLELRKRLGFPEVPHDKDTDYDEDQALAPTQRVSGLAPGSSDECAGSGRDCPDRSAEYHPRDLQQQGGRSFPGKAHPGGCAQRQHLDSLRRHRRRPRD